MVYSKYEIFFISLIFNTVEKHATSKQLTELGLRPSRFCEVSKSKYYIDKTELIRHYLCGEQHMIINAPRRFGKTINMDMLKEFLEIKVNEYGERLADNSETKELYKKFKVFEDSKLVEEHLGQYPVIHTDFKNENIHSSECVLEGLRQALHLAYKQHEYLMKSKLLNESMKHEFHQYFDTEKHKQLGIDKIISGLKFLSSVLYMCYQKKVHIFIDEYDSPIRHSMYKSNINVEDVAELIFSILLCVLKCNDDCAERGFLTGIGYANAGPFNDYHRFSFLNDYFATFYGATDSEVQELFRKHGMSKDKLLEAKEWYGGYTTCTSGTNICNLGSIVNFCKEGKAKSYWESSGTAGNLNGLFKVAQINNEMNKLILGYNISCQLSEINLEDLKHLNELIANSKFPRVQTDKVMTLLLEMGYLSYTLPLKQSCSTSSTNCTLKLPNKETKTEFVNMAHDHYQLKCGFTWRNSILALNHFSATADWKVFANFVASFQMFIQTFIDKDHYYIIDEITFQSSLYVMLRQTKFRVGTEVVTKEQEKIVQIFVAMTPKKLLIILALLYKRSANEAFQQVESDDLPMSHSKYSCPIDKILVGLNIDTNLNVTMKYQINDCISVLIP